MITVLYTIVELIVAGNSTENLCTWYVENRADIKN